MSNLNAPEGYDFSGWATRVNVRCSDGRIISKDAFKHMDGKTVPLVWGHNHTAPEKVLGKAILQHREGEGIYAYAFFNDTESGKTAKTLVEHGDVNALSIHANQLRESMNVVQHGMIREVSLVLAGANPEAFIENIMSHGEIMEDDYNIYTGDYITLAHEDEEGENLKVNTDESLNHEEGEKSGGKTVAEVLDSLNDEQTEVVESLLAIAIAGAEDDEEDDEDDDEESRGGDKTMKHNLFDQDEQQTGRVLSHADQAAIIELAKQSNVGSLQTAIKTYMSENDSLSHGIDDIELLFPEYKDVHPGAPELIERDQTWVGEVMRKTHKSPISRIRTRQMDARGADLRAHGYQKKGDEKTLSGNLKLMSRTTDPQTVYRKDALHRDDIIDITEFDVVNYQYGVMKSNLYEDLALATMIGDGRDDGDPDKIQEEHIRPIWKDDELYTIHHDVDVAAAKAELQGTNTGANFGENYIYAEALVTASLYSREQYKGSGNLEFYCTPHLLNVMLLARDLNGRRIYDSKADLAKALNVSAIHTAEQFEGQIRTTATGEKKKLLGLFVNLNDYQHGSTKGGEITRFEQFDIDFNLNKYLIETRLSGALIKIKSAIALEEPVTEEAAG